MPLLHPGDTFPELPLTVPGGQQFTVPDWFGGRLRGGAVQSTGFVLGPGGQVIVSVYSSGLIGRLMPEDAAGLVRYVRQHAAS